MLQHGHLQGVFVAVPEDLFHWHLLVCCSASSTPNLHGEAHEPLILRSFELHSILSNRNELKQKW
jgi:hypothetical protein